MKFKRTYTCGQLTKKDLKQEVVLMGWTHSRRDHGGIIFIDLRDRYGLTQVVFDPEHNSDVHKQAEHLRREDVIAVKGHVRSRPENMTNPNMYTGEIEVLVDDLEILNKSDTPPMEIDDRIRISEDVALKYRFLDLRKPRLQKNLMTRHKVAKIARDYFAELGFLDIETPMLGKSTPEGSRDYLVPSRVHPGRFYALPQSPQLFKQLLMVAGFDKYCQLARCFRDEDLRADRQPDFTQIDIEMSFIDQSDIYPVMEGFIKKVWKEVLNIDLKTPFPKITYQDAMDKYGSDKPDMRFGLELVNISEIAKRSDFKVFAETAEKGGTIKGINVKGAGEKLSRKDIDDMIPFVQIYDAKGLAWMKMTDAGLEGSIVKFFQPEIQKELINKMKAEKGDLLVFVGDKKHFIVNNSLGQLRLKLAKDLGLIKEKFNFIWVIDFPLLEYDENEQRHVAVHHPFTSPLDEDVHLLDSDPGKVRAKAYDIALNGTEIGGGSIRIHKRELQEKMFSILGITKEDAEVKFGFLLEAFKYGAPPHGGFAFGFDRLCAIICDEDSIRDVIAFPKTKDAVSLMDGAPSDVSEKQLKELGLKLDIVKKA